MSDGKLFGMPIVETSLFDDMPPQIMLGDLSQYAGIGAVLAELGYSGFSAIPVHEGKRVEMRTAEGDAVSADMDGHGVFMIAIFEKQRVAFYRTKTAEEVVLYGTGVKKPIGILSHDPD